ncbi:class F sortase [Nocardioides sp.]|uniref:class F sortase n=1 Tax=Nocardioides sp. TaxID=35761 RepID=UPI0026351559|nr:class F sortase [Nocardioides sp.]
MLFVKDVRRRWISTMICLLGLVGSGLVLAEPAHAGDAPPVAATAFTAPLCSGTTTSDPADVPAADHDGYTDLTQVFGARLTSYNKGNVVPLYDTTGWGDATYPPLCGVYYDAATNSPKSVWMFCTDVDKHACGDIGPGGTLQDGTTDVGEMNDKPGNARLTADQQAVIAWLITNGHDFSYTGFASHADQSTYDTRNALQYLVWCISDESTIEADFPGLCTTNISAAEQASILTKVPARSVVDLNLASSGTPVRVGQTRTISLTTNVYNQPITLTATGTASGTLTVCSGSATLSGSTLTVDGTSPATSTTIGLCLSPTAAGSYGLKASAQAVQTEELQWAQADSDCQVFARFRIDAGAPVTDLVGFTVAERATVPGSPRLITTASHRVATPGTALSDTIELSGFVDGHGARGTAVLYGPLSKVTARSCTAANRFATVAFDPRNGRVRTPRVTVTRAGYYTWVASTSADSANKAATHGCGLAQETTLIRKKHYELTKVDTGFSGPVASIVERSSSTPRLVMPAAGVDASVVNVGVSGGQMQVPGAVSTIGRVDRSAAINDAIGTVVLAGHVSDRRDSPGALWSLKKAKRGQILRYVVGGTVYRFKVTSVRRTSRSSTLPASLASTTGAHRLVVISCTGKVVRNGRFHYTQNLIVTAVPIR